MSDLKMQPLAPGARYPAPQPDPGLQQEADPQPDQEHQQEAGPQPDPEQEAEAQPDPNAPKRPEGPHRIGIVNRIPVVALTVDEEVFYKGFMKKREDKLRMKIDLRLMPLLTILYLLATLDRANIANAKIEGLKDDTNLTDKQYNVVLAIFFIPYCLLEVPSNIFLKGLSKPSRYVAFLVVTWGFIMTCHVWAKNFAGLVFLRLLLGVAESGFVPAAMYLCSQWYPPDALAFRLCIFMAFSAASGAFSGLLAAAISQLGDRGGLYSWQWIFLIEGCVTMVLGGATFFLLIDSPEHATSWLDDDELRFLKLQRSVMDGGEAAVQDATLCDDIKAIVKDWRYWAFGVFFHCVGAIGFGLEFVIPSMIRGLGYSRTRSQLLSTTPYVCGFVMSLVSSWASDAFQYRSIFAITGLAAITLGLGLITLTASGGTRSSRLGNITAGMSLITSGVFPMVPTVGSWVSNNTRTPNRRAIGLAFVMAIGSLGGLTGSFMYKESESPEYPTGIQTSFGLAGAGVLIIVILLVSYWRENKEIARLEAAEAAAAENPPQNGRQTYQRYML